MATVVEGRRMSAAEAAQFYHTRKSAIEAKLREIDANLRHPRIIARRRDALVAESEGLRKNLARAEAAIARWAETAHAERELRVALDARIKDARAALMAAQDTLDSLCRERALLE